MKLLITGGFGYLGGRLVKYFAENNNNEILIGSRYQKELIRNMKQTQIVRTEWASEKQLRAICNSVDAIIHVAGMNAHDCAQKPDSALECNGVNTARLLQAAIAEKVKRFIYVSTAHVYSYSLSGKITEETFTTNLHPYASSHRAGEDVVRFAHERGEIEGIIIRLANAYGAPTCKDANCWMLLVNDICKQAVVNKKIRLYSSGKQQRNFITITDTCCAINHLLDLPCTKLGDGIFNVGGSKSTTVMSMAEQVSQCAEKMLSKKIDISTQNVLEEKADLLNYDISKLSSTGFQLSGDSASQIEFINLINFCVENFKHA